MKAKINEKVEDTNLIQFINKSGKITYWGKDLRTGRNCISASFNNAHDMKSKQYASNTVKYLKDYGYSSVILINNKRVSRTIKVPNTSKIKIIKIKKITRVIENPIIYQK